MSLVSLLVSTVFYLVSFWIHKISISSQLYKFMSLRESKWRINISALIYEQKIYRKKY